MANESLNQLAEDAKHPFNFITLSEMRGIYDQWVELKEAARTAHQFALEVKHAQSVGSNWYTKGERGLFMQIRMWADKTLKACNDALKENVDV